MIALFVRDGDQARLFRIDPKISYRRIRKIEDVIGSSFTHVVTYYDWFKAGKEIQDAHDALRARQPELFDL